MSDLYCNPWRHEPHGLREVLRWKLGFGPKEIASYPEAIQSASITAISPAELDIPSSGWRIHWLGHASFLLSGSGMRLLIDPIFSDYCSPFPFRFSSLKRHVPPPLALADLPKIDGILLTHHHYDHCDLATLRHFPNDTKIIVAEGHRNWLMRKGFTNVHELPWWQHHQAGEVKIIATPAQHFTARSLLDRNKAHWCGWSIEAAGKRLWHTGDSGYCEVFREIGERLGPFDMSMIPIGAYAPRWFMKSMHMNPQEAVQVFQDSRTIQAIAMHWGTFSLTEEPLGEAPILLEKAIRDAGIDHSRFTAGAVGQCWIVA